METLVWASSTNEAEDTESANEMDTSSFKRLQIFENTLRIAIISVTVVTVMMCLVSAFWLLLMIPTVYLIKYSSSLLWFVVFYLIAVLLSYYA